MAQRLQHGAEQDEQADHGGDQRHGAEHELPVTDARQPQDCNRHHKHNANRNGGGAPGVCDLERRGGHVNLLRGELVGRVDDEHEKGQGGRDRDDVEEGPRTRPEHADDRCHAHVFATLEGNDRAQHGEPQEQDRSEFIRPHDRLVKDVTCQDAGKQNNDLGDDQQRRRDLDQRAQDGIDPGRPVARAGRTFLQNTRRCVVR